MYLFIMVDFLGVILLKKRNPIAVKKVIGNRKGFYENFIFQCLGLFSLSFFLELAIIACFFLFFT